MWYGRVDGAPVPRRASTRSNLRPRDPAGNVGHAARAPRSCVRYVALGRPRSWSLAGARFAIRVSSDARRVRWTLGGAAAWHGRGRSGCGRRSSTAGSR